MMSCEKEKFPYSFFILLILTLFCFSCQTQLLVQIYVNIITGSGVMIIFFYKGLTRNPEIGNTYVWGLPTVQGLGRVRDIKFGTNISNKVLLNAAKCQGYNFYYRFRVIKRKPTANRMGRGKLTTHTHTHSQIRVKINYKTVCIGSR